MTIKTVHSKEKLKELFDFFSKIFFEESKKNDEKYSQMTERYNEMETQFETDPELLLYIENKNKIIAGVTIKNRKESKATVGILAVAEEYRGQELAVKLMTEIEDRCVKKGIKHLNLGARPRASKFYYRLGWHPALMVQVFDFETVEHVLEINEGFRNFNVLNTMKQPAYGFVFFEVNEIDSEVIKHFENNLEVCNVIYVFDKTLED